MRHASNGTSQTAWGDFKRLIGLYLRMHTEEALFASTWLAKRENATRADDFITGRHFSGMVT